MSENFIQALRMKGREIAAMASPVSFKDRFTGNRGAESTRDTPVISQALLTDPRPYAGSDEQPSFPTQGICEDILRRANVAEAELISPEERKAIRKIQATARKLHYKILELDTEGVLNAKRESRRRIKQGRATEADLHFEKGKLFEARKAMRRQQATEIKKANPMLVAISQRFQDVARRVLPELERESTRLGIQPKHVPAVRECACACWGVVPVARTNIQPPAQFLKRIGIKL